MKLSGSALRILLVEDNAINQKVAVRILERFGYTVDVAADGVEALEALKCKPYHFVLMDLQMPRMNGLEATERIRSDFAAEEQPFIAALTANAMLGDRERCLQAGMNEYLSKPVDRDALHALIQSVEERVLDTQEVK
jgi:CheY-like chemotaxis protein